ncbi:Chalcone isomerase - like 3 [Theobroma cacao]|nr:Chalcone isomerase - like 3 [Theobroma cacao]
MFLLMPDYVAVRGLYIDGNFKKFTSIGVYLEPNTVPLLAAKWRGKSPFEKFTQVVENCLAYWTFSGGYTDAEAKADEEFLDIFKKETFPPDVCIPKVGNTMIENKQLSETVLETTVGKNGVFPAARWSLASSRSQASIYTNPKVGSYTSDSANAVGRVLNPNSIPWKLGIMMLRVEHKILQQQLHALFNQSLQSLTQSRTFNTDPRTNSL